jgi:hypothetical protein
LLRGLCDAVPAACCVLRVVVSRAARCVLNARSLLRCGLLRRSRTVLRAALATVVAVCRMCVECVSNVLQARADARCAVLCACAVAQQPALYFRVHLIAACGVRKIEAKRSALGTQFGFLLRRTSDKTTTLQLNSIQKPKRQTHSNAHNDSQTIAPARAIAGNLGGEQKHRTPATNRDRHIHHSSINS